MSSSDESRQKRAKANADAYVIRLRDAVDLPELRRCMTESFLNDEIKDTGIAAYLPLVLKDPFGSPEILLKRYAEGLNGESYLIVAQDKASGKVKPGEPLAGCIGAVPLNPFELELVRLFVDKSQRGKGLGTILVNNVLSYAEQHGYERVFLRCGSPSGQALYRSLGFREASRGYFWKNVKNQRKIQKVALLGGTHGNELVGVHLVKEVWRESSTFAKELETSSFELKVYLCNENAMRQNVRFVDRDLNRCFELDELLQPRKEEEAKSETKRAQWLNQELGPKCDIPTSIGKWKQSCPGRVDYLIDMHSTTSNMGICLISLAGDALTIRLAHELQQKFASRLDLPPFNLLIDMDCARTLNNNIDSIPPSAICIEVGPLAHGTLTNKSLFDGTRFAVKESLKVLEEFNNRGDAESVMAKYSPRTIDGYTLWKPVSYPKEAGSVTITAMLHPTLVGADFKPLSKGDAMFVDLGTGEVVVRYEEDAVAYPCFIGEAAYVASGIAMWLCKKKTFDVYG